MINFILRALDKVALAAVAALLIYTIWSDIEEVRRAERMRRQALQDADAIEETIRRNHDVWKPVPRDEAAASGRVLKPWKDLPRIGSLQPSDLGP